MRERSKFVRLINDLIEEGTALSLFSPKDKEVSELNSPLNLNLYLNLNDLFLVKSREEENTNPIWEFRQQIFTGIQFGDELEFG